MEGILFREKRLVAAIKARKSPPLHSVVVTGDFSLSLGARWVVAVAIPSTDAAVFPMNQHFTTPANG
jgi:hypothetical protein